MPNNTKRLLAALAFFVWMAFVLAAFYVVQKPMFFGGLSGLANTVWTIAVTFLISSNALGIGYALLDRIGREHTSATERVLLGIGLGLGMMGLLGFCFGALGITAKPILIGFQIVFGILLIWRRIWRSITIDLCTIKSAWVGISSEIHPLTKIAFSLSFMFAFLLALAPPIEAFDSLSYHLSAPMRILKDGGIQPYDVYAFWHPGLVEGSFLWGLGLGSDRVAQLLHGIWAVLAVLLIGYWAKTGWSVSIAQKSVLVILSLTSLYRLASWAYTDLALAFYSIAALYAIVKWLESKAHSSYFWLVFTGVMTGMAMGIKYTSFMLPISIVLIILVSCRKDRLGSLKWAAIFIFTSVLVAAPWYLRNLIVMGNPFYPFFFGGRYWDDFRNVLYTGEGSGIGWNLLDLILLPLNATLGHHDATYYGGRIGPLFLIMSPLTLFGIIKNSRGLPLQRRSVFSISLFVVLSGLAWTFGVINTAHLWQTRFLYPAMILLSLLTAFGWKAAEILDTPKLRLSFILNILIGAVVIFNLLDAGFTLIQRNPIAFALGIETRQHYLEKVQPAYANAMQLLERTPVGAKIYFLFEPRGYYAGREVQEDLILDNLAHDLYLYGSNEQVLASWKDHGYTHVLVYRQGVDYLVENPSVSFTPGLFKALEDLVRSHLTLVDTTGDGAYELYLIPPE